MLAVRAHRKARSYVNNLEQQSERLNKHKRKAVDTHHGSFSPEETHNDASVRAHLVCKQP